MEGTADVSEERVLAALQILYHGAPGDRAGADAFLREFQRSSSAFHVAAAIVQRLVGTNDLSSTPILFFSAQTLATKLRLGDLQHADAVYWSQQLLSWLANASHQPTAVQTQLALAFVAAILHVDTSQPLQMQSEGGDNTVIGFLIQLLQQSQPPVSAGVTALTLAIVIEQVQDIGDRTRRRKLQQEVDFWANAVLNEILPQLMTHEEEGQKLVLRALQTWVKESRMEDVRGLLRNRVVQSLPQYLGDAELFESSNEVVVELVKCCSAYGNDGGKELLLWIVPQVLLPLKEQFQSACQSQDTEVCKGLCRVFTETSEAYLDLLLHEQGDDVFSQSLLELLLDCMTYPEVEVADVTLPFWLKLLDELVRKDDVGNWKELLVRLAAACMRILPFPEDFLDMPEDRQQDFKAFRVEVGDILRDCSDLVGVDQVLEQSVTGLQHSSGWQQTEACLYAIRSVARIVEKQQTAAAETRLQLVFQQLPQMKFHPAVAYTACLIVSRYADWLRLRPDLLRLQVAFLNDCIQNLGKENKWEVARAAATAVRSVAEDCWSLLGNDVVQFYITLEAQGEQVLNVEDQVLLLEGCCKGVVSSGDAQMTGQLVEQVVSAVGRKLESVKSSGTGDVVGMEMAMQEMLRLLCLYEFLNNPDQLAQVTNRMWPLILDLMQLYYKSDAFVERVCRLVKRMLRECGQYVVTVLPSVVEMIVGYYQQEPKSSFLYLTSLLVKSFANDQEQQQTLRSTVETLMKSTLPLFRSVESIQTHPDVVEELFFLLDRCLQVLPSVFQEEDTMKECLQAAVVSLQVPHSDANKGALCFLERVLKMSMSGKDGLSHYLQSIVGNPDYSRFLLHQILAGAILGSLPSGRVDADVGSVAGVLALLAQMDGARLRTEMDKWLQQATSNGDWLSASDANGFLNDLFTAEDEWCFRRSVRHFARQCSKKQSVG